MRLWDLKPNFSKGKRTQTEFQPLPPSIICRKAVGWFISFASKHYFEKLPTNLLIPSTGPCRLLSCFVPHFAPFLFSLPFPSLPGPEKWKGHLSLPPTLALLPAFHATSHSMCGRLVSRRSRDLGGNRRPSWPLWFRHRASAAACSQTLVKTQRSGCVVQCRSTRRLLTWTATQLQSWATGDRARMNAHH